MTVSASDPTDPRSRLIGQAAAVLAEAKQVQHSAPAHWAGALYEAGLLSLPEPAAPAAEPGAELDDQDFAGAFEAAAADSEAETTGVNIPTRIDVITNDSGKTAPLMLDLGQDVCIVLQPKPDQGIGELALNIVVGAGLPVEIVAWMLGQAAETLVNGIRNSPFIRPV